MATYYVKTTGSDAADGLSEANAWLTIDKAMNTVAAGDVVNVKAGTYLETANIDTAGTATAPIHFRGYTTTPGDTNSAACVVIDGGSVRASGITCTPTTVHYIFSNITIQNCTGTGWAFGTTPDIITLRHCRGTACGAWGGQADDAVTLDHCQFDSNTTGGWDSDASCLAVHCTFNGNPIGAQMDSGVCYDCVFYDNDSGAKTNLYVAGNYSHVCAQIGCTFDGENTASTYGVSYHSASALPPNALLDCILYDHGTGVAEGRNLGEQVIARNNCFYSNTTDRTNWATGFNELSASPLFVDEATRDYSLSDGSPCIGGSMNGGDIGARPRPHHSFGVTEGAAS